MKHLLRSFVQCRRLIQVICLIKDHLVNYTEFNCRYTRRNLTIYLKQNSGWKVYTGLDRQHIPCHMEAEGSI